MTPANRRNKFRWLPGSGTLLPLSAPLALSPVDDIEGGIFCEILAPNIPQFSLNGSTMRVYRTREESLSTARPRHRCSLLA